MGLMEWIYRSDVPNGVDVLLVFAMIVAAVFAYSAAYSADNASAASLGWERVALETNYTLMMTRANLTASNIILCQDMKTRCIPKNAVNSTGLNNTLNYIKDICGPLPACQ